MPVRRTKSNKILSNIPLQNCDVTKKVDGVNSKYFADSSADVVQDINEPILTEIEKNMPLAEDHGVYYPVTTQQRDIYRTKTGKRLTAHQWAVYDFTMTIPRGKVTTYKEVASAAGGSPRSVGSALRNNPFSPYVPCHRVIASNLFIGGFFGEWGKDHKTGTRYNEKVTILSHEGVHFNDSGHLKAADKVLWKL